MLLCIRLNNKNNKIIFRLNFDFLIYFELNKCPCFLRKTLTAPLYSNEMKQFLNFAAKRKGKEILLDIKKIVILVRREKDRKGAPISIGCSKR